MIEIVEMNGQRRTQTLRGDISLNEAAGDLVVKYQNRPRTRVDVYGLNIYRTDGSQSQLHGISPKDGHDIGAITKIPYDVIQEIMS
ncbi:MAG: hypothetical protein LBL84_01725 [Candidatus Nomurabacteria bacterium]|jgi:hypothetical protein|nr:hypothetical protein [Candidatus Nomurabacteria bacterium]